MDTIKKLNLKGHLLTAISYMIPIVCGAGFLIAIGMAFGGDTSADLTHLGFNLWDAMAVMGAAGLGLLPVVIATGVSYSIADKPGIAPGFIGGLTANTIGAGFIGGILGGFIAGFAAILVIKYVKVPSWAKGLMPTLIIPFVASLIVGLIMVYIIGAPIALFTKMLTDFLNGMGTSSLLVFGLVIGILSGIDYGGPINKTVFAFVLAMQAEGVNGPITSLQLVNTATPIGFGLAYYVAKMMNKDIYTRTEIETLKAAVPMGVVNIVEGIIPIVMNDIVKCIIATAAGGAVGGAISMALGANATVPFGGFLMIPTMENPMGGIISIIANVIVTALVLAILKKNVKDKNLDIVLEEEELNLDDIQII